jgi:hypothetical protein
MLAACNALSGADDLSTDDCPGCGGVTRAPQRSETELTEPVEPRGPSPAKVDGGASSTLPPDIDAAPPETTPVDPAGAVKCGAATCSGAKPACCFSGGAATCIGAGESCLGARLACDQRADCGAGEVCCLDTSGAEARCRARAVCASGPTIELCAADPECPFGSACRAHIEPLGFLGCN